MGLIAPSTKRQKPGDLQKPQALDQPRSLPIPNDLIFRSLFFLDTQAMITTIPLVNREFYVLSKDEYYWKMKSFYEYEIPFSPQDRKEMAEGRLKVEDFIDQKAPTLLVGDIRNWKDYFLSQCKKRKARFDQGLSLISDQSIKFWSVQEISQHLFKVQLETETFSHLDKDYFASLSQAGISQENQQEMKTLVREYRLLAIFLSRAFILDDRPLMTKIREHHNATIKKLERSCDQRALEIFKRDFLTEYKMEFWRSLMQSTHGKITTFENADYFLESLKGMGLTLDDSSADEKHFVFNTALDGKNAQIVAFVEKLGAAPDERSLKIAMSIGLVEIAEKLSQGREFDPQDPDDLVGSALASGKTEMFQWVLAKVPGIEMDYMHLVTATLSGNLELVRLLLPRQLFKNILKQHPSRFLKIALIAKNKPMLDLLAGRKKPSRLISKEDKHKLFATAINEKNVALIQFLVDQKIYPGKRALNMALKTKNDAIIMLLLKFCRFIPNMNELLANADAFVSNVYQIPAIRNPKSLYKMKEKIEAKLKQVETDPKVKEIEPALQKSLQFIMQLIKKYSPGPDEVEIHSDSSDSESAGEISEEIDEEMAPEEAPAQPAVPADAAAEDSDTSGED